VATYLFSNNAQTTIPGSITAAATSIAVQSGAAFSAPGTGDQFVARIENTGTPGSTVYEYVLVTTNSANTFTVTRGVEGTSGFAFTAGATITQVWTAAAMVSTPRGTLGYAAITANQTNITGLADITSLAVTVTVGAGRRLRLSAYCYAFTGGTADGYDVNIAEGATQLTQYRITNPGGTGFAVNPVVVIQPTAGAHTYKVTAVHSSGANAGAFNAQATAPGFILCEDIGT